jgi:hypothetical protein
VQQYSPRGKLSVLASRASGVQWCGDEVLTRATLVCIGTVLYNSPAVQSKGGNFSLAACGDVAVGRVEWCSVDKRCTDFWTSFCEFRVWAGRTSVTCLGLGHSRVACPVVVVPGRARYYHGPGDSIQHSMVAIECLLNVCVCVQNTGGCSCCCCAIRPPISLSGGDIPVYLKVMLSSRRLQRNAVVPH